MSERSYGHEKTGFGTWLWDNGSACLQRDAVGDLSRKKQTLLNARILQKNMKY
jgi:hypothetical protein